MSSKAARPVFCIYICYDICHTGLTVFGLYVFILIIIQCLAQLVPANVTSHSLWTGLLVRAASLRPTSSLVHSRYVVNVRLFHLVEVKDVRKRESHCQNSQTLLGEGGLTFRESSCTFLDSLMELGARVSIAMMVESAAIAVLYHSPDTRGLFPPGRSQSCICLISFMPYKLRSDPS